MFSSIHVRVKNTFLDFHDLDGFDDKVVATRARSVDSKRNRDGFMSSQGQELQVWRSGKILPLVGNADRAKSPMAIQTSHASEEDADQIDSPSVEDLLFLYNRLSEVCLHRSGDAQSPKQLTRTFVHTEVTSSSPISVLSEEENIECSSNPVFKFEHRPASSGCSTCSFADSFDLMDEGESRRESALNESSLSVSLGQSSTHIQFAQPFLPLSGWIDHIRPAQDVLRPYTAMASPKATEKKCRNVPKRVDLSKENTSFATESASTTLMIRNIPRRYTPNVLMNEIDELGAQGKYNFFYLPFDFGTRSNVGYAFVNFSNVVDARQCTDSLLNYRFKNHPGSTTRAVLVSPAHIQGLEANLAHYEKCAVTSSRLKKSRPVVLAVAPETMTQYLSDNTTGNGQ